jgi:WD40 repeat protein
VWSTSASSGVRILNGHAARVPQLDFSPDGRLLASVSVDGDAIVWDVRSGARTRTFGRQCLSTRTITFSPDGSTIAIGDDDRMICFWNVRTGALRGSVSGLPWELFDLKYHPSGRVLFAVGRGTDLMVVDPEAGAELATFAAHTRLIMSLRLTPDGRHLITAGDDDWIGAWDLDHLRRCAAGNTVFQSTRIQNETKR